jgi:aspartate-semialdehyde dehydrogenase
MMVLQPPVFHGHSLALFLEMEQAVDRERLSQALAGDHVTIAGSEEESQPSNVNTAGQGDILVSLKADSAKPNGIWVYAAADNLRVAAITAVECAESMIATRPMGKIQ